MLKAYREEVLASLQWVTDHFQHLGWVTAAVTPRVVGGWGHTPGMTLPDGLTADTLTAMPDVVERARRLAERAHAGQEDKAGEDYFTGHLTDVWERARDYGATSDDQAAALLHDVVEDTDVTDEDLWRAGSPTGPS